VRASGSSAHPRTCSSTTTAPKHLVGLHTCRTAATTTSSRWSSWRTVPTFLRFRLKQISGTLALLLAVDIAFGRSGTTGSVKAFLTRVRVAARWPGAAKTDRNSSRASHRFRPDTFKLTED
jgi:hypothetical protein